MEFTTIISVNEFKRVSLFCSVFVLFFIERAFIRTTRSSPFCALVCAYLVPWWDKKGLDDVMSILSPCLIGIITSSCTTPYTR